MTWTDTEQSQSSIEAQLKIEMDIGFIFEKSKITETYTSKLQETTTKTASQTEKITVTSNCDYVEGAFASALYQWVTESHDGGITVMTGEYQCRYNELAYEMPHCPAFACDNTSSHYQCEKCKSDWEA